MACRLFFSRNATPASSIKNRLSRGAKRLPASNAERASFQNSNCARARPYWYSNSAESADADTLAPAAASASQRSCREGGSLEGEGEGEGEGERLDSTCAGTGKEQKTNKARSSLQQNRMGIFFTSTAQTRPCGCYRRPAGGWGSASRVQ